MSSQSPCEHSFPDYIIPGARELNQAQVSKHLELLANFRSHVLVARMNPLQIGLELIEFLKREASLS